MCGNDAPRECTNVNHSEKIESQFAFIFSSSRTFSYTRNSIEVEFPLLESS